jgi:hypothetical protein
VERWKDHNRVGRGSRRSAVSRPRIHPNPGDANARRLVSELRADFLQGSRTGAAARPEARATILSPFRLAILPFFHPSLLRSSSGRSLVQNRFDLTRRRCLRNSY